MLFDLWGTLIRHDPEAGELRRQARVRAVHEGLERNGIIIDAQDVEAGCIAASLAHERVHAEERDVTARGRTVLYLHHIEDGLPDRIPEGAWDDLDAAVLTPALRYPPLVMEHAVETLTTVKAAGLPIALVSNAGVTPGFVLRELLERFGLLPHFDALVFSDEVELAKPSRAIFQHALDELGVEAGEAAFVGDHPLLDVLGARRAGLWMVQIGDSEPEGTEPHARIAGLDELLPALRGLGLVSHPAGHASPAS